jgi:hypothetical protein
MLRSGIHGPSHVCLERILGVSRMAIPAHGLVTASLEVILGSRNYPPIANRAPNRGQPVRNPSLRERESNATTASSGAARGHGVERARRGARPEHQLYRLPTSAPDSLPAAISCHIGIPDTSPTRHGRSSGARGGIGRTSLTSEACAADRTRQERTPPPPGKRLSEPAVEEWSRALKTAAGQPVSDRIAVPRGFLPRETSVS